MKYILICTAVVVLSGVTNAAPVIYTDEASYLAALAALDGSTVYESFEDDVAWADSRNSIVAPGRTPTVTSQGIVWTSNYAQNEIATGTVGGYTADGIYALYSLPHGLTTDSGLYCDSAEDPDIPIQCYQNDGLKVEAETGGALYAFGGRIDTANSGKVTFLLDGVDINGNDTDNIDNWQREGDWADDWAFVGVIDADGFSSAELRELRGKDYQQVYLFADDFTIQTAAAATLPGDFDLDNDVDGADFLKWQRGETTPPYSPSDLLAWQSNYDTSPQIAAAAVPEPNSLGLAVVAGLVGVALKRARRADRRGSDFRRGRVR